MSVEWGPIAIIAICFTVIVIVLTFKNEIRRSIRNNSAKKNAEPIIETAKEVYAADENYINQDLQDEVALCLDEMDNKIWLNSFNKKEYATSLLELETHIATLEDAYEIMKYKVLSAYVTSMIDFDHSIEMFMELIDLYPVECEVYVWFSQIYSSRKLFIQAITIIDAGLDNISKNPTLVLLKAEFLGEMGNHQEGIDCIQSSIDKKTYNSIIYFTLAKLYKAQDDNEQQLYTYIKGFQLNKLNDDHLLDFATELAAAGKSKESLYILKILEKKNPKDFNVICLIGNAYFKLGLYDSALIAYTEADKLCDGKQEWIKANIGNIYHNIGFYSSATDHLKKAVKLSPEYEFALERLTNAVEAKNKEVNVQKELLKKAQEFFLQRV
ncbi:MAG: hypothetical protein CVU84_01610 [Firmicutes bacterium HGW-Firmicutes-1]|jgi:tetratricopeptide (TPR) repeat protein|nr:MAG: hypothetical protein CVU84_01610 [Firmicutes bacterium HGW-Firmicutes-1]